MTNAEQERLLFWRLFEEELEKQGNPFHLEDRAYYATVNRKSANSDYCLSVDFLLRKQFVRVGLYINDDVPAFEYMLKHRSEIEERLGFQPMWTQRGEKNINTRRIEKHISLIPYSPSRYLRVIKQTIEYIKRFKEVIPLYSCELLFDF